MKRKSDKKEVLALTVSKIIASIPECKTEDELKEFLRKDALRPKAERIAEGENLLEEAKRELENATYLY